MKECECEVKNAIMEDWYLIGWENMTVVDKLLWLLKSKELILTFNTLYQRIYLHDKSDCKETQAKINRLSIELDKLMGTEEFLKLKQRNVSDIYFGYINSRNIEKMNFSPNEIWEVVISKEFCHHKSGLDCDNPQNTGKRYPVPLSDQKEGYLPIDPFPKCLKKYCPIKVCKEC